MLIKVPGRDDPQGLPSAARAAGLVLEATITRLLDFLGPVLEGGQRQVRTAKHRGLGAGMRLWNRPEHDVEETGRPDRLLCLYVRGTP